jgi:hypothetical protein
MTIIISDKIRGKLLDKHGVTDEEVSQCFANRTGKLLADNRDKHKSIPPTQWFIAPTNKGRLLKICFVPDGDYFLRSCFPPDDEELRIYRKYGQPTDF